MSGIMVLWEMASTTTQLHSAQLWRHLVLQEGSSRSLPAPTLLHPSEERQIAQSIFLAALISQLWAPVQETHLSSGPREVIEEILISSTCSDRRISDLAIWPLMETS